MAELIYVDSNKIWLFPCANRTKNVESKLMTEHNFTHIPSLLCTSQGYVWEEYEQDTNFIQFVIGGYFIKIRKEILANYIKEEETPGENNIYAHIALYRKDLLSTTSGVSTDNVNATLVLSKYQINESGTTANIYLVDNLDITQEQSTSSVFMGIVFTDFEEKPTIKNISDSSLYKQYVLQIIKNGQITNKAPITTNEIRDNNITKDKLSTDLISNGSASDNGITVSLSQNTTDNGFNIGIISTSVEEADHAENSDTAINATNVNLTATEGSGENIETTTIKAGNGVAATFKIPMAQNSRKVENKLTIISDDTKTFDGDEAISVSLAALNHTHGSINNDGTISGANSILCTDATQNIITKQITTTTTAPIPYVKETQFVYKINQDTYGNITANTSEFSTGVLKIQGSSGDATTIFEENSTSNNDNTLKFAVGTGTSISGSPSVDVSIKNKICTLKFDNIIGSGFNIKASKDKCINIGDCYIDTDATSSSYRYLRVRTKKEGSEDDFDNVAKIMGTDGKDGTNGENGKDGTDAESISYVLSGKNSSGSDIKSNIISTTGQSITLGASGINAKSYGNQTSQVLNYGSSFKVPQFTVNSQGILIQGEDKTLTLPNAQDIPAYKHSTAYCTTSGADGIKKAEHLDYKKVKGFEVITFVNANTYKNQISLSINGQTNGILYINNSISNSSNYNIPAGAYLLYCDGTNYYLNTTGALTTAGIMSYGNIYDTGNLTVKNGIYFEDNKNIEIINEKLDGTTTSDQLRVFAKSGINFVIEHKDGVHTPINFSCTKQLSSTAIYMDPCFGSIYASAYKYLSDSALKTNIVEYKPEKSILDLSVKKFDFIDGEQNQIGCLAQDLQKICPELVSETESGHLAIQESKLIYLLLDEVKKLRTEVNTLKKKK